MARQSIPVLNLQDYLSDDENRKNKFVQELGEALVDIGFFSLTGHGIDLNHIDKATLLRRVLCTIRGHQSQVRKQRRSCTTYPYSLD